MTRECTDAETDAGLLLSQAPGQEHCGETQVRKTGPEWQVSTACRVHDNPIDTTFTFRGNFRTDYAGRFEVRYGTICPRNLPECRETREFTARRLGEWLRSNRDRIVDALRAVQAGTDGHSKTALWAVRTDCG